MNFPTNSEKMIYVSFLKSSLIIFCFLTTHSLFGQLESEAEAKAEILTAETAPRHDTATNSYLAKLNPYKATDSVVSEKQLAKKVLLNTQASKGIIHLAIFEIPAEFTTIDIIDTGGKTVERVRIPEERNAFLDLDVSMMKNGLYKLRIANKEKVFSQSEFILQK